MNVFDKPNLSQILIVDDSATDRKLAGGLLKKNPDWVIDFAEDGQHALEKISVSCPDLVLTDLQMPHVNGLELVENLRENFPSVPTILMTAKGSEDIAMQALQTGAASYVSKNHLIANLVQTVRMVLTASSVEQSYSRLMDSVQEMTFVFENDLSLISMLVSHLRQSVQQRNICDNRDAIRVATSLEEALLNAYYHGNLEMDSSLKEEDHNLFFETASQRLIEQPYNDRKISLRVKFSEDGVEFKIKDDGAGFNPDELPDPTDPEYLDRPSGRGVLLMKSFMDEMIFNEVGNEVTLIKNRSTEKEMATTS